MRELSEAQQNEAVQRIAFDEAIFMAINSERALPNPDKAKISAMVERNIENIKALWVLVPSYIGRKHEMVLPARKRYPSDPPSYQPGY